MLGVASPAQTVQNALAKKRRRWGADLKYKTAEELRLADTARRKAARKQRRRCRSADGLVCSEVFEGEGRLEEGEQLSGPKKATSRYVVLEWIELIPN